MKLDGGFEQVMREHAQRGWLAARPKLGDGVSYLVVSPKDLMKIETIELILKLSNLLLVCHHAGVAAVRLPHDLVDDELRVTVDVKPLDPELNDDEQSVDECLILYHIVGYAEV
jgi:hypothetical protein